MRKLKLHLWAGAAAGLATLLLAVPANAASIVLDALDSGWYDDGGFHGQANENYLAGNRAVEYRNFFVFDLSSIAGQTLLAAELRLENPVSGYESPDPSETYGVFDVGTPVAALVAGGPSGPVGQLTFADLGSGTPYGSVSISESDEGTLVTIALNATALADLQLAAGLFAFGGAITTLGGASIEDAFRFTGSDSTRQLVVFPVPEPSSLPLLAVGVAALALLRRRRRSTPLLAIALAFAAGPAGAATISNWPASSFAGGFGEPIPFTSPNPLPYMGQTFTAPDGTLDSLRFVMQGEGPSLSNVGDTVFHLLITEFTGTAGGQGFHPITTCNGSPGVCFESADLVVPLGLAEHEFEVQLGGLALNAGQEYFLVFDAWVTRDGIGNDIGVGTRSFPGVDGIPRSNGVSSSDTSATRDQHFAEFWNITVTGDIAYVLTYTPVPEPGTGALCAVGLAALGLARRRGRARRARATDPLETQGAQPAPGTSRTPFGA